MKYFAMVCVLLFGIVIGACTSSVQADGSDNHDTFNGAQLESPYTNSTMSRVDDGNVSCYFLRWNNDVKMNCVNVGGDRGSDEVK